MAIDFRNMDEKQRGKVFLCVAMVVALAVGISIVILGERKRKAPEQGDMNIYPEIQDAEREKGAGKRSDAYNETMRDDPSIEDYWNSLGSDDAYDGGTDSGAQAAEPSRSASAERTVDDVFGVKEPEQQPSQPAKPSGTAQSRREQNEAAAERARRESEERSRRILLLQDSIRRAQEAQAKPDAESAPKEKKEEERPTIADVAGAGAVQAQSDGDGWNESSKIVSWGDADDATADEMRPYRCMVVKETKVHSGDRITVRLMEDIRVENVFIPKYTYLFAGATISDRLDLKISAIESQGRIYSVRFDAYDANDQIKGIHCPDLNRQQREAVRQGGIRSGGGILRRNIAGEVLSEAVNTGVQVAESASGNVTVTLPEGYLFYIVYNNQNN